MLLHDAQLQSASEYLNDTAPREAFYYPCYQQEATVTFVTPEAAHTQVQGLTHLVQDFKEARHLPQA